MNHLQTLYVVVFQVEARDKRVGVPILIGHASIERGRSAWPWVQSGQDLLAMSSSQLDP
jgi:hypothetical protein